ncbi:FadR family transcriptional regulator [Clostridium sardiniense]|uniref:FadR family transcriptional regulator n=1 Tax=Clostridium sardiniense TaxID=29369 RepID=A0ABS7KX51_CLOSR|nr:FadR/GntR family transcriptional regulator [Clostridium sardiniense]MBY0755376.1 FadR family transcriptional regulator [Clostridium sardiniense]MDQ0459823.1 GntR family transcriptional repressor for pyruvate dehydrogenase complex [Clostridium sardiniense]
MDAPAKNTKVYEEVVERIKKMIEEGELKIGDKLPTERAMAEELNVSRASIREAIRSLEVIGLIESIQGAGNYIKNDFSEILLEPLSMMFMLQQGSAIDIYELREVLELSTIMLSAERISKEELKKLKELIEKFKESDIESNNVIIDKEFHYTIVKSANNPLITNLLNVLSQVIDKFITDSRKNILESSENKERLLKLHERVYIALENRNSLEAYTALKEHFELIKEYIK